MTHRKLPDEVTNAVRALVSLLQERIVGIGPRRGRKHRDLSYITGSWNDDEFQEFNRDLAEQRKIDPVMWK